MLETASGFAAGPHLCHQRSSTRRLAARHKISRCVTALPQPRRNHYYLQRRAVRCVHKRSGGHIKSSVPQSVHPVMESFRKLRTLVRRECERLAVDAGNERAGQAFQTQVDALLSAVLGGGVLSEQIFTVVWRYRTAIGRYLEFSMNQKQLLLERLDRFADHCEQHSRASVNDERPREPSAPAPGHPSKRQLTVTTHPDPTGTKPNLAYCAITREQLRRHPCYEALPPVEALVIERPEDLTRIRQDSALWLEARRHMRVNASSAWKALGFGEPATLEWLRECVPAWQFRRGGEAALEAWRQWREPGLDAETFSPASMISMEWGKMHEQNGLLTVLRYLESARTADAASCYYSIVPGDGAPDRGLVPGASTATNTSFAKLVLVEAGLHMLQPASCAGIYDLDEFSALPTIAASPDALLRWRSPLHSEARTQDTQPNTLAASSDLSHDIELVEVKCPCPFVPTGDMTDGPRLTDEATDRPLYRYRLVSPQRLIYANHFAQVQLQMLCTDTWRAHFISWTPDAGARLFVVERDEMWLEMALITLRDFYREFQQAPPPVNFFADRATYRQLLERTVAGVRQSAHQSVTLSAEEVDRLLAWEREAGYWEPVESLFLS